VGPDDEVLIHVTLSPALEALRAGLDGDVPTVFDPVPDRPAGVDLLGRLSRGSRHKLVDATG
jgi:hypothetical protein